jgi:hypothetical protein
MRRGGYRSEGNAYKVWVGKIQVKRPLGTTRRRLENNIKMDIRERDWDGIAGFVLLRMWIGGGFF